MAEKAENRENLTVGEIENDKKKILNIGSGVKYGLSTKNEKENRRTESSSQFSLTENPVVDLTNESRKGPLINDGKNGAPNEYAYPASGDKVEDNKKKTKKKKASSDSAEEEDENAIYLSALEKDHIYPLKNKSKKNVDPFFFCRLCNMHLAKKDIDLHREDEDHIYKRKKNSKKEKRSKNSQEKPKANTEVKKEAQTEHKQAAETEKKRISKLPLKSLQEMDEKTSFEDLCCVLEKEKIFPLRKKSIRFPKAKFFCRLCDYHMDAVEDCKKHCRDNRHKRRKEVSNFESKLKNIPSPLPSHLAALDDLVERIFSENGLSEEDVRYREEVTRELEAKLTKDEQLKDVKLVLYGSSLSSVGTKESDVNIDLVVPHKANHAKALMQAFKIIKTLEGFKDVQSHFSSKVPCVMFTERGRGLSCQLTIGSDLAQETNKLLLMYTKCDPRFRKLAVAFRYWAKICRVDCQMEGTVPAFCFVIMTVYFLQQCSPPVLPVLETYKDDKQTPSKKLPTPKHLDVDLVSTQSGMWHSKNTESVGSLWLKMLEFYSLDFDHSVNIICIRQQKVLPRAEKKWNTKRLAIEDPFYPKRNAARSVQSFELFEYIWDCIRISYLYFGLPSNFGSFSETDQSEFLERMSKKAVKNDKSRIKEERPESLEVSDHAEDSENISEEANREKVNSIGELSDCNETGTRGPASCKQACSDKAASPECDVGTKISSSLDCKAGSKEDKQCTDVKSSTAGSSMSQEISQSSSIEELAKGIVDNVVKTALSVFQSQSMESQHDAVNADSGKTSENKWDEVNHGSDFVQMEKADSSMGIQEKNLEYNYVFSLDTLSDGKGPKVLCVICEKEGHLKMNCPEDTLPELHPLPAMTKEHLMILTDVLNKVPMDFAPSWDEVREREAIRRELEQFIQELYPTARLELFGSSNNGFGFRHSDLDLCMTFSDLPVPENLDYVDCIERVTKKLKTHKGLYNVFPITTAKVPIIKFRHRRSQLEGDISLYNLLALHNTRMINLYSTMDPRVKVLGYAIKVFAKICEIGDASRGSLSSYAYILMLIYYLQQCKPPVLPVLQELHLDEKPERMVEGWNAWHFDELATLPKLWEDFGKNKASAGELWTGLFRFYTEEFKMDEHVVCIRQHETLTRFEKLWNGKCIAIEDPFDLNHNLGGGLSRKMHQYIVKALVHGRSLYCTPVRNIPPKFSSPADYFFDKDKLTLGGSPPNDRGCRVCLKIGHIAKECPVVLNRKERDVRERERRQMEAKKQDEREYINQQRDLSHGRNTQQREFPHNQNSHQREHPHNQNSHQGNYVQRGYRRSNSESQDYAPNTRQSLQRQPLPHQYPPMPGFMPAHIPQRDNRSIPNNLPPPQHLSQAYSRPQGGMNITGPPSRQQLNRMPRQDAQFNMSRSPMPRHPDPRMHQNQNHGPYTQGTQLLQGQFPGFQQVVSPPQSPNQGLEPGRVVNPRGQMQMGITVSNEYYRGGNPDQQRYSNPQYRGQPNRPTPRK
uniref:Terminal uridylyltransferase 4-like isoform X1 n=1 Tax=Crassostrea virginica TaxID=6565 RepID=A0A8B8CG19_CRAVI|nr:terminal uridylyltransferase 4-like isoform X1 [Crassostrea virginica]